MNRQILLSPMLFAAMLTTTPECTYACSEEGIGFAIERGGGTIDCDGPTVVVLQSEVVIDRNVTLDGQGLLTLDGNTSHRVLSVLPGVTAELRGIAITNGDGDIGDGGCILNDGDLTLTEVTVYGCPYGTPVYNTGTMVVDQCAVEDNVSASGRASGIFNSGDASIVDSHISRNRGSVQGAISNTGTLLLERSTVAQNEGDGNSGGIENRGAMTILQSAVIENQGDTGPGGVYNADGATLTILDSDVSNNVNVEYTTGILAYGIVTISNTTISANRAMYDAAPASIDVRGTLTISQSAITTPDPDVYAVSGDGELFITETTLGSGCRFTGAVTSTGGNAETPGDTCGLDHPTDLVNVP